jgi:hypothetical protein
MGKTVNWKSITNVGRMSLIYMAATFVENLENLEKAVFFEKVMENHGNVVENHGWSWKSHGKFFSMQNNFAGKS